MVDAKRASYGVDNALFAVTQLAQTTMRSDIGKISLDKTFEERDTLNRSIVEAIRCVTPPPPQPPIDTLLRTGPSNDCNPERVACIWGTVAQALLILCISSWHVPAKKAL